MTVNKLVLEYVIVAWCTYTDESKH